jgi:hypothetical protein
VVFDIEGRAAVAGSSVEDVLEREAAFHDILIKYATANL